MGCLCSKVQEPVGFLNNDLLEAKKNPIEISITPIQNFDDNVFEKQTPTTPLLNNIAFAQVNSETSDSIDDEEIEKLLNENQEEEDRSLSDDENKDKDEDINGNDEINFEEVSDN